MIRLKKGLDLPITGAPQQHIENKPVSTVALLGQDYPGIKPELRVAVGERVQCGQVLFTDRKQPGVMYTAPAGGIVSAINRGEHRALLSLAITVDAEEQWQSFTRYEAAALSVLEGGAVKEHLLQSGLWTALRTRPYSRIPAPDSTPHAIFVTAMDSNPLAADPAVVLQGREQAFSDGLVVLSRLTPGRLYLCQAPAAAVPRATVDNLEVVEFAGPHPAGLPGTHIHHLAPAGRRRTVWYIHYQDVIAIGQLFTSGRLSTERVIALGGPQVTRPRLLRTRLGASVSELVAGELQDDDNRIIAGSVLCGRQALPPQDYLGRYHHQVSVIREDREQELLGWLRLGRDKYSLLNLFSSRLAGRQHFSLTTSTGGEPRPMVPLDSYEAVLPMDILVTPLLRALIVGDLENAEALGALELDEEDLALCTFICPGKYDYGPLLRDVLNRIEKAG